MQGLIVYSQPNCNPCKQVKSWLSGKGIEYKEVDVTQDVDAFNRLKSLGYQITPVIETPTDHWSGVNLQKMKELVNA